MASQAFLHEGRDQMLPNVYGAQRHHPERLWLRHYQPPDDVVLQSHPRHGLPAVGVPELVNRSILVPDIRCCRWVTSQENTPEWASGGAI